MKKNIGCDMICHTYYDTIESRYKMRAEKSIEYVDYRYSFANQGHKVSNNNNNKVQEYIFVGY
jgi:hypothetical protein